MGSKNMGVVIVMNVNKIDVYGSFTQALFFSGNANIPKYMLTHYSDLGISNQEMLLLIHILSEVDENPFPTKELLAKRMNTSAFEVEQMLGQLIERKLISIERHWNATESGWSQTYSLVGLINNLADLWVIERHRQYEKELLLTQNRETAAQANINPTIQKVVTVFEEELGRPLTGLECEHINGWISSRYSEDLIVEALRRGVSAGIRNFRYLDSILREWEKKGLRTRADVERDDVDFQARQDKKTRVKPSPKKNTNKYDNFYL